MRRLNASSWLARFCLLVIFCLLRVGHFAFVCHLPTSLFIFPAFSCQSRSLFFYRSFKFLDARVVCLHVSKIHLRILRCNFVVCINNSRHLARKYAQIFSANIICSEKRTVFRELRGTDNVQRQISEHIFAPTIVFIRLVHTSDGIGSGVGSASVRSVTIQCK